MNKRLITATVLASTLVLASCGKETVKEVLVTSPPVEIPVTPSNKFDDYLEYLYRTSAQARSWTDSDLLELGTTVCEAFEIGRTLDSVITTFAENSTGKYDTDLFVSIIVGSVTYLCPEFETVVSSQLSS